MEPMLLFLLGQQGIELYILVDKDGICQNDGPNEAQLCLNWWAAQNPARSLFIAAFLPACPCTIFHAFFDPRFFIYLVFNANGIGFKQCAISRTLFTSQVGFTDANTLIIYQK